MANEIAQWLEGLGLGQYAQTFADNDVDFEVLPDLTDDELRELGLSLGHRKKLLRAVESRNEQSVAPDTTTTRPTHETPSREAERRQLTVLFCDLVGSTALSSRLDPEDMRDVLGAYQNACAGVIARYDGFVAKFMGDGVYAYFGYPRAHEDDAERAINAGLGIVEAVGALDHDLQVRIGVATGTVAVGDIVGEGASEEANVVGEAPNLAARLQEIAAPDTVVIGEATRALVGELFETEDLGARDLKGFAVPVSAWAVLRAHQSKTRFEATRGANLSRMVGREEEMVALMRRWERSKSGEGQVVLISGEPGIGKSRLVHEFRNRITDETSFVRTFQCSPQHSASALFPFIEIANQAIGLLPDDSAETKLDKLEAWICSANQSPEELAPVYGPAYGIDTTARYPPLDVSPERNKQLLMEALTDRLTKASEFHSGCLLTYEDAHWIDATSLDYLDLQVGQILNLAAIQVRAEGISQRVRPDEIETAAFPGYEGRGQIKQQSQQPARPQGGHPRREHGDEHGQAGHEAGRNPAECMQHQHRAETEFRCNDEKRNTHECRPPHESSSSAPTPASVVSSSSSFNVTLDNS